MWRPRLPWDRSLEGPGGCAHVRANETGGQGRAEGWDGRDTGLSQCPPVVVPSQSSASAQLQPGSCGPASALCRNLLAIGMLHSGLLGQQPLPSRRKATLRPVSASLRLGREAGTRPSSFWTEAAPSKERREDGRSHARGRAAEAGGNRHRLCPLGAGGCHAAAQGAAGRAGPRRARPGSVGGESRARGAGRAWAARSPGTGLAPLGAPPRPCPARGDHPRARAQPSQSSRGISGRDPPALRVRRGDARPSAKPAGPGTGRTAGNAGFVCKMLICLSCGSPYLFQ